MSQKKGSITNQITALEKDLQEKTEKLEIYEKILNKLCKEIFGMKKTDIEKLISEKKNNTNFSVKEEQGLEGAGETNSSGYSWNMDSPAGDSPAAF